MLRADLERFGTPVGLQYGESRPFKQSFAEFEDLEFVVDDEDGRRSF
jgi:hypothetical protein